MDMRFHRLTYVTIQIVQLVLVELCVAAEGHNFKWVKSLIL